MPSIALSCLNFCGPYSPYRWGFFTSVLLWLTCQPVGGLSAFGSGLIWLGSRSNRFPRGGWGGRIGSDDLARFSESSWAVCVGPRPVRTFSFLTFKSSNLHPVCAPRSSWQTLNSWLASAAFSCISLSALTSRDWPIPVLLRLSGMEWAYPRERPFRSFQLSA